MLGRSKLATKTRALLQRQALDDVGARVARRRWR
jgi:hypothetical protein